MRMRHLISLTRCIKQKARMFCVCWISPIPLRLHKTHARYYIAHADNCTKLLCFMMRGALKVVWLGYISSNLFSKLVFRDSCLLKPWCTSTLVILHRPPKKNLRRHHYGRTGLRALRGTRTIATTTATARSQRERGKCDGAACVRLYDALSIGFWLIVVRPRRAVPSCGEHGISSRHI